MRAKYFLKGMGIGVTVTALLFTIAFALNPPTLSDEEVIARAKQLGMVESEETKEEQEAIDEETSEEAADGESTEEAADGETTDGESADESEAGDGEEASGDGDRSDTGTDDSAATDTGTTSEEVSDEEAMKALRKMLDEQEAEANAGRKDADNSAYKSTDTVDAKATEEAAGTPGNTISFTVNSGEDSSTVAARMHRAGIVDDPTDFDTYLAQHGYDTRIHPGSYNIPEGASYEAIAKAIAW